ncbi:TonB-dependent receptor [Pseudoalteromonas umbrosa]|uniref:TonB-dependent receptor n=1 Tax=Pseudoalteromonas umbrosa TaxID=3048489 RepID=UPI0024C3B146|nr:TonB-dependent receptor [Pseudoalteromonas sp. B95]MDK1288316.1 TonB-dependent receptor [Pseudoalteromonas sp. B95]
MRNLFLLLSGLQLSTLAIASEQSLRVDIEPQPLVQALFQVAKQSEQSIFTQPALLKGYQTAQVKGQFTLDELLQILLKDTGLKVKQASSGFIVYRPNKAHDAKRKKRKSGSKNNSEIERISVLGQKGASTEAVWLKHNYQVGLVDLIAADDIGELPDINVADSYRRIVGVHTINDSDEGQLVTVRGVQSGMNSVTLDGMALASDRQHTRGVNLETIPASSVGQLWLYKTPDVSFNGNSVGAVMDLKSYSAFEKRSPHFRFDAELSQYSYQNVPDDDDKLGLNIRSQYSRVFGQDSQFGLVAFGMYSEKSRDQSNLSNQYHVNKDGQAFINRSRQSAYSNVWVRQGGSIKLEAAPTEQSYGFWHSYYYQQTENEPRNSFAFEQVPRTPVKVRQDQAEIEQADLVLDTIYRDTARRQLGSHIHFKNELSSRQNLSFDIAYSEASSDRQDEESVWQSATSPKEYHLLGYQYTGFYSDRSWSVNDPRFAQSPRTIKLDEFELQRRANNNTILDSRVLYSWHAEGSRLGWSVKSGLRYTHSKMRSNRDVNRYDVKKDIPIGKLVGDSRYSVDAFGLNLPWLSSEYVSNYFDENISGFELNNNASEFASLRHDFNSVDKVSAAHIELINQSDRWRWSIGTRYESWQQETQGQDINMNTQSVTPNTLSLKDSQWLGVLRGRYDITDNWRIFASVGQSVARPDYFASNNLNSVNERRDYTVIKRSDPNLKTSLAESWDLSTEYYWRDGNLASMALFKKYIDDTAVDTRTVLGEQDNRVILEQKSNYGQSEVNGVELSLTLQDWSAWSRHLRGFGLVANATILSHEVCYEIPNQAVSCLDYQFGQADKTANVIAHYRFVGSKTEIRLGYHYAGEYSPYQPLPLTAQTREVWQAFSQWDMQLRYDVNKNWVMKAKVRNLTNEKRRSMTGEHQQMLASEIEFGRSVWFGVSYRG